PRSAVPGNSGLRAFPTRRSSDLGADSGPEFVMAMDLEDVTSPERLKRRVAAGALASLEGKSDQADAICKALASIKGLTLSIEMSDRKSTRLNSSHRTISYAVFCL